jgi:hypothetical protein
MPIQVKHWKQRTFLSPSTLLMLGNQQLQLFYYITNI